MDHCRSLVEQQLPVCLISLNLIVIVSLQVLLTYVIPFIPDFQELALLASWCIKIFRKDIEASRRNLKHK